MISTFISFLGQKWFFLKMVKEALNITKHNNHNKLRVAEKKGIWKKLFPFHSRIDYLSWDEPSWRWYIMPINKVTKMMHSAPTPEKLVLSLLLFPKQLVITQCVTILYLNGNAILFFKVLSVDLQLTK